MDESKNEAAETAVAQRFEIAVRTMSGRFEITNARLDLEETARYVCLRCGWLYRELQPRCGNCHAQYKVMPRDGVNSLPGPRDRSLDGTVEIKENYLRTGIAWLDGALGGGIPDYACWLLAGGEGAGKSTLALMALAQLPTKGPPLLISTEMHSSEVASYAQRLGMRRDAVILGSEDDISRARRVMDLAREHRAGSVMVDSVGDLEDESPRMTAVKQLKNWAVNHRKPVVLISQVNAQGEAAGRRQRRHDVTLYTRMWKSDADADVRYFIVEKTRHARKDRVVYTVRKTADGRLEYVPPPPPSPPATPKEKPADKA